MASGVGAFISQRMGYERGWRWLQGSQEGSQEGS
jgi:hypothetical protein